MIDFKNTEIAFKMKSNGELRNARFLFSLVKSPAMVDTLSGLSNFALKMHLPIGLIIKPTLYKHFVGGDSLMQCIHVAKRMYKYNVSSLFDYAVESAKCEDDIISTFNEIKKSIKLASENDFVPFTVFKATALILPEILKKINNDIKLLEEEETQYKQFVDRIDELCRLSAEAKVPIIVDAEDYAYQKAIDEVVEQMIIRYNKDYAWVYNTLQMYRTDRLAYLREQIEKAKTGNYVLGVKFVRGAYMEKERELAKIGNYPSPIQATKSETDSDFNEGLRLAVANIEHVHIFSGTHNQESCYVLIQEMKKHNIANNDKRIFFAQLYGMSDDLSFNIGHAGYNVVKYVPYGKIKQVLPYLMRRARENTAMAGQTSRELNLVKKEIARRKGKK